MRRRRRTGCPYRQTPIPARHWRGSRRRPPAESRWHAVRRQCPWKFAAIAASWSAARRRTSSHGSPAGRRASPLLAEGSSQSCRRPSVPPVWPCSFLPLLRPLRTPALTAGLFPKQDLHLTPRLLLFPAPFAPGARLLGAKVKFLNVLGMHQPLENIVHDDPADLEHIAVMRRLQRDLGVLLNQQDRHALFFVDPPDDGENLPHQD